MVNGAGGVSVSVNAQMVCDEMAGCNTWAPAPVHWARPWFGEGNTWLSALPLEISAGISQRESAACRQGPNLLSLSAWPTLVTICVGRSAAGKVLFFVTENRGFAVNPCKPHGPEAAASPPLPLSRVTSFSRALRTALQGRLRSPLSPGRILLSFSGDPDLQL